MSYKQNLIKAARERRIRMHILPRLQSFSMTGQATGRLMDVGLIGQPLFTQGSIPVRAIIKAVSDAHHVAVEDICGAGRGRVFVRARMHAIRLIRVIWPSMSLPEIGRKVGGKNHTSIINALERWPHYRTTLGREIAIVTGILRLDHSY
jgi:chromosomal replication initiator protein